MAATFVVKKGSTGKLRFILAAVFATALLAGCGGDHDNQPAHNASGTRQTATTGRPDAQTPSAASADPCPLSAQQVSDAVGATVEKDPACTFAPADDNEPSVAFVRQVDFACDGNRPSEAGYDERVDGFDVDAYAQRSKAVVGSSILVCTRPPFEISVALPGGFEQGGSDRELAAATQLAHLVINRS